MKPERSAPSGTGWTHWESTLVSTISTRKTPHRSSSVLLWHAACWEYEHILQITTAKQRDVFVCAAETSTTPWWSSSCTRRSKYQWTGTESTNLPTLNWAATWRRYNSSTQFKSHTMALSVSVLQRTLISLFKGKDIHLWWIWKPPKTFSLNLTLCTKSTLPFLESSNFHSYYMQNLQWCSLSWSHYEFLKYFCIHSQQPMIGMKTSFTNNFFLLCDTYYACCNDTLHISVKGFTWSGLCPAVNNRTSNILGISSIHISVLNPSLCLCVPAGEL